MREMKRMGANGKQFGSKNRDTLQGSKEWPLRKRSKSCPKLAVNQQEITPASEPTGISPDILPKDKRGGKSGIF